MEFNPDKVRKITSEIFSALGRMEDLQKLSEETFVADPHKIGSAKYSLIIAIEGAVDLCNHVISKNGYRTPEDYADTFRVMAEQGCFDEEFTTKNNNETLFSRKWGESSLIRITLRRRENHPHHTLPH